ncbi:Hypothetical predicted protein [Cloeon dipterum]|uniref:Uncharacterized protein n=1 Tax=Cloeon dipterum TaxID=197152 RepID=A0A8S1E3A5_9INSE|nr:Hypothetical predicted protein [Cloeon dipterum]
MIVAIVISTFSIVARTRAVITIPPVDPIVTLRPGRTLVSLQNFKSARQFSNGVGGRGGGGAYLTGAFNLHNIKHAVSNHSQFVQSHSALWGRLVFLTPTACSAFAFLGIIQERCGHRQFVSAWMTNIFHPACTNMTTLIEPSKYDELLKTTGEQNKTISLELRKGMEAFTSKLKEKDSMINSLALRVNESIGALAQH